MTPHRLTNNPNCKWLGRTSPIVGPAKTGRQSQPAIRKLRCITMGMMATSTISKFRNEPYADFSVPENRQAMEAALAKVRSEFGREYQLRLDGQWIATGDK